jgi:hypothetical protein
MGRITRDIKTEDGRAFDRNDRVKLKGFGELDEEKNNYTAPNS